MKLFVFLFLIGGSLAALKSGEVAKEASGSNAELDCSAEEGTIHVIWARYGKNCASGGSIQTSNLRTACDGKDSCTYLVNHNVIGDPAGGCAKTYNFEYTCSNKNGVVAKEAHGKSAALSCGDDRIDVVFAWYGRNCERSPSDQTNNLGNACNGQKDCTYAISVNNIGDPAGGCQKEYDFSYNCIANPCEDKECNDGVYCNGEETCNEEDGECIPGQTVECELYFRCDNDAKKCVRDCGTFAIDGYLRECSAEFEESELELSSLSNRITTVDGKVDFESGRIDTNIGNIQQNSDDVTALKTALDTANDEIDSLKARLDALMPLAGEDPPEAKGQSVTGFPSIQDWVNKYKGELIFCLAIVNIILMFMIGSKWCRSPKKAQPVRINYSSDQEQARLTKS